MVGRAGLWVSHGAPVRLQMERELGYKDAKYVMHLEAVASLDASSAAKAASADLGFHGARVLRRAASDPSETLGGSALGRWARSRGVSSLRHEINIEFINRRGLLTSYGDDSRSRLCGDGGGDPLLDLAIQVDLDIACV